MVALDSRRLLVLAAVSDHGGVVAAAEMLHLTPSAVSQQLARLEREAGVALVDRSRRQVRLTVAGEQLAERGRRIATELEAAEADVAQWFGATGTTVVIAGFATAIKRLLVALVPQLYSDHRVTLRIVERGTREAVAELHAGEVDMAIAEVMPAEGVPSGATASAARNHATGPDERLQTVLRLADAYRIAVPADWPVAQWLEDGTVVGELARRPWVGSASGSASSGALARLMEAWQVHADVAHEADELSTLVSLVASGLGAGVVPQLAWSDATDHTALLDTADVEAASGRPTHLGVRAIEVRVRATPRQVPALTLVVAALRRAAEDNAMIIEPC